MKTKVPLFEGLTNPSKLPKPQGRVEYFSNTTPSNLPKPPINK